MYAPTIFLVVFLLEPIHWIAANGGQQKWHFTPITLAWQHEASDILGVEIVWTMENFWESRGSPLTSPQTLVDIRGDGNCYFRAISYVVTGEQDSHEKIREAVVNYMRNHMQSEVQEKHLEEMEKAKTWATDMEITATARLLKTPVFVYTPYGDDDWAWAQYTPNTDYSLVLDDTIPRIYLKMVNRCHFEVVSAVVADAAAAAVVAPRDNYKKNQKWHYTPITLAWQHQARDILGVDVVWTMENFWDSRGSPLTSPKQLVATQDDGNSFFRAISYVVTGEEDSHEQIRKAVVKYMRKHMQSAVQEKHLKNMAKGGTLATDKEITATARLLQTPVFVYTPYGDDDWDWAQYTPNRDYSLVLDDTIPRIYLKMVNRCHFEVVADVNPE